MAEQSTQDEHESTSAQPTVTGKKQAKPKKKGDYKVGKNKPPVETQFKPGQSGNPGGKPTGSISLIGILKKRLAEINPDNRRSYAEQFIDNMLQDAMDLDGPSRKTVMQYIEGMPKQQMIIDTDKNSIDELTDFFRAVARGESVRAAEMPELPAPPEVITPPDATGGSTSA